MKLTELFQIQYPIIQGGMIWASGANLASAVSNCGGLGLIGAASMSPELLDLQIKKAQAKTSSSFGVNIPLIYKNAQQQIDISLQNNIKIFFLSAGSPKKFTKYIKNKNKSAIIVHVTSSPSLAIKCQDAGVDAIVAEGFEAGGHNGKDELTTMILVPQVVDSVQIPVIAAGGIATGRQMLAAFSLGASAVQIGSLFASSLESSSHINFKEKIIVSSSADTQLYLKDHIPVRLIENDFTSQLKQLNKLEDKIKLLGIGRAKKGMRDGDLDSGELEIGQCCGQIKRIESVCSIFDKLIKDYNLMIDNLRPLK